MPHINFKNCSSLVLTLVLSACFVLGSVYTTHAATIDGLSGTANDGSSGVILDGSTPTNGVRPNFLSNNSSSGNCNSATQLCNPLQFKSFDEFFTGLLHIIVIFAIPIIILMIIYAGFLYVMARGSEEQVTKASRALTYAVLGGLIILGAELILQVVQGTVSQLTI